MNAMTTVTMADGTMQVVAEVSARDGTALTLLAEGQRLAARRAFSCLVEPEPGDRVLVARSGGAAYVLAVLERPGAAPMRVALPDGCSIEAEGGRLDLAAGTLVLRARQGEVVVDALAVSGGTATLRVGTVTLIAEAIETLARRVIGRFGRSYRFVEESEQLRARDIDQRASGHLHLKGDTASIQAGAVVKVDANQIHLG
ncbi:DUF3540 domain-containing protein [Neoroseomonas lacus]|uniref:DUF3540 domain-containing protein n=1 Tax=Neoroseomonas lacus TaxID=287609 RepID=A0A917NRJ2_9PROT|nr:DUF3540 domain-containing protein [Neoroseomonas lacus]GGJ21640.1 hypothetical protein GCM10011320_31190 [Neoroseomonas lacus]